MAEPDGRVVVEIEGDDSGLENAVSDANAELRNMDGAAAALGNTLKTVFSIAMIKEFAQAVYDVGSAYEYSLSKVQSIADTTAVSIEQISGDVLELSSQTGAAAADINEAVYQAISAGVDSAKAVQTVEVAVKSAKAGFTDTATAVDGLTTVMNSFKAANLEADEVANKFLITQNLGKTSFGELAASIGGVAPTANAAGVSIDELLASVAALTANGINTSSAMTGMKAALSNIITPSSNAKKMAEELGIQFDAAALKSKGFSQFMREIAEATDGDTEKMAQLFGSVEALNTMLTLTSEGGAALFDKTMSEMATNTTALDTAYETMTDNLTAKTDILKTAAENFGIDIFQSISGGLGDAVGTITDYVNRLHDAFMNGGISALGGELFQIAFDAVSELGQGIAEALPEIVRESVKLTVTVANTIIDNIPTIVDTASDIMIAFADALTDEQTLMYLLEKTPEIITKLDLALVDAIPDLLDCSVKFYETMADNLVNYDWSEAANRTMHNLIDAFADTIDRVKENLVIVDDLFNGGNTFGGDTDNVPDFFGGLESRLHLAADTLTWYTEQAEQTFDGYYSTGRDIMTEGEREMQAAEEAAAERERVFAEKSAWYSEYYSGKAKEAADIVAAANKKTGDSATGAAETTEEATDKVSEEFEAFYKNLETLKAHNDISDEEFKKRLSEKLHSSSEYLGYAYNRYWEKIKDTNKKAAAKTKESVSEDFKKFYDEQNLLLSMGEENGGISEETFYKNLDSKLNSIADSKTNTAYASYWEKVKSYNKKQANENARQQEKSDKETLDRQKKAAQRELEQLKTDLSGLQSEYRKKLSDLVSERDKFKDKLSANILSTSEESITDKRTGQTVKKKTDTVADIQKKIDARKKLGSALESLVKKGIPKNLLSELAGMDPEDALRFAEQLNAMDADKWQNIVKSYNEYEEINQKIANDIYGPQISALNEQFSADLGGVLDGVTGEAAEKGAELISAYVSGVDMSSDKALEDIRKFADDAIKQINDAISDSTLVGGKMELALDNVDGAGAGENIADQIADGIENNSDRITAAIEAAVERAFGDAKTAVTVKTSAISQNVSASVPAEHQSGGMLSANEKTVERIIYRDVKLVWKDGQTLARIVNSENKMTGIQGGTHD